KHQGNHTKQNNAENNDLVNILLAESQVAGSLRNHMTDAKTSYIFGIYIIMSGRNKPYGIINIRHKMGKITKARAEQILYARNNTSHKHILRRLLDKLFTALVAQVFCTLRIPKGLR